MSSGGCGNPKKRNAPNVIGHPSQQLLSATASGTRPVAGKSTSIPTGGCYRVRKRSASKLDDLQEVAHKLP